MIKKNYVLSANIKKPKFIYRRRLKNGIYRKHRVAKRIAHETGVANRRKNKVELPAVEYPARLRKKYCDNYQRGQLFC